MNGREICNILGDLFDSHIYQELERDYNPRLTIEINNIELLSTRDLRKILRTLKVLFAIGND